MKKMFALKKIIILTVILSVALSVGALAVQYKTNTRVNFRTGASTDSKFIKTLSKDQILNMITFDAAGWSKVNIDGKEGYVKSEFIAVIEDKPLPDAAPLIATVASQTTVAQQKYVTNTRVNFRKTPTTTGEKYKTLNAGVALIILETLQDGWYKVEIDAVVGYIKSEYVSLSDGAKTPNSDTNYSVELTPWKDAKNIFLLNKPAKIVDVRSGNIYYVQSFSNGSHADVETITQSDTDIMKKTFGNAWSWDVRPVFVTINGHTMAASINGMPHGGGIIANNGMDGQVCIHFLGSVTHNGNKSFETTHQNGVMEAWNAR